MGLAKGTWWLSAASHDAWAQAEQDAVLLQISSRHHRLRAAVPSAAQSWDEAAPRSFQGKGTVLLRGHLCRPGCPSLPAPALLGEHTP